MGFSAKKAAGVGWSQFKREAVCVLKTVELEGSVTQALWNPDGFIMSPRYQTLSYRIWCLPCWALVFLWYDLSLLCRHSLLLEWECLLCAIVYWNCVTCLFYGQLKGGLESQVRTGF